MEHGTTARPWGGMRDLKRFVASRSGRLPTVGEVPPYGIIGVSPSKYLERDPDPPYIRRDIDERLDDAIVKQRFLLLVGHSKAGKSRSAFEATRRLFPTSTLVVPFSSTRSLAQLIRDPPFDADSPLPVLCSTSSTGTWATPAESIARSPTSARAATGEWWLWEPSPGLSQALSSHALNPPYRGHQDATTNAAVGRASSPGR